ncbi:AraC family transcriptional regulator [Pseudomonas sp. RIT-PI-S]|uniref:AraC family transcriptional regulator n=1 Tax=Pseudomonas sp. RIT-PI-S TaxID=3035295 RepID=UPI0021D7DE8B|nr:AraC family transcriptional regulator [Pseudomonas sp. RIT-PI-S]
MGDEAFEPGGRMVELLQGLAPLEGYNLSGLADVRFLRSNRALADTPVLYDPGIVIVCQGRKRGYWGGETYLYDAQHYLAVALPVPFTMETDATAAQPLLAIYFHLDVPLATELMLELSARRFPLAEPKGMYASPMEPPLRASVLRFLEAMASPIDSVVLGPALKREIYYRILSGAQGGSLRSALAQEGDFGKVAKALRRIHASVGQPLTISELAREANMSVSAFHAHFKKATRTSPVQYLKATRLHLARLLMFRNTVTAASAATTVGYESTSQFSREFKRLFGRTPKEEVAWMRQAFALPAPSVPSGYVASH